MWARRWTSFDLATTNKEFSSIPADDLDALFRAMKAYRMEVGGGYEVKSYGDGLMMIKASNQTQGRCLFFSVSEDEGVEVLTALLAYKKETQEAPRHVIETARQRLRQTMERK